MVTVTRIMEQSRAWKKTITICMHFLFSLLRDDHDSLMRCFKVVKILVKEKFLAILEVISCDDLDVKEIYSLKKMYLISDEAVHSSLREHRFLKLIATLKLKTSFLTTISPALSKMDHQCFF